MSEETFPAQHCYWLWCLFFENRTDTPGHIVHRHLAQVNFHFL